MMYVSSGISQSSLSIYVSITMICCYLGSCLISASDGESGRTKHHRSYHKKESKPNSPEKGSLPSHVPVPFSNCHVRGDVIQQAIPIVCTASKKLIVPSILSSSVYHYQPLIHNPVAPASIPVANFLHGRVQRSSTLAGDRTVGRLIASCSYSSCHCLRHHPTHLHDPSSSLSPPYRPSHPH